MDDAQWLALRRKLDPRRKDRAESTYEKNVNQRRMEVVQNALESGYLKILDAELILTSQEQLGASKEELKRLNRVLRISLPRWHIQLLDSSALSECTRLTICNLSSCYVRDITAFRSCPRLLKLDLSNNQIVDVPDASFWSSLTSLRVLHLHGNAISDKECARRISGCSQLHVLTLYNTPFSLLAGYRHNVVNSIVSLKALDSYVISDEEIVENLHLDGKFKSESSSFKLQLYQPVPQATSFEEELRKTRRLLLNVDKILSKHSPVLIIQRCVRGWLTRRALHGDCHSRVKPHWGRVHGRVEGSGAIHPPSRAESDGPQPHPPPPPTPSVPWTYQQEHEHGGGRGGGGGGSSLPFVKSGFPKEKKRILHVDLYGDPQLEQSTSEVRTRSRSQTPRSRPTSHKGHGRPAAGGRRRSTSTQGGGASATEQSNGSKHLAEEQTIEGAAIREKQTFHDVRADCHGVAIQPMNLTTEVTKARQRSGKMTRDAEREIAAILSKGTRQAPRTEPVRPALTKDQLLFVSAYVSLATSTIKTLENLGRLKRKDEELARKAALVARLKEDRACRAEHVEAFRQSLKEGIHAWKDRHVEVLLKKKRTVAVEKGTISSYHAAMRDREALRARMLKEDKEFEIEFNMQNVAIGDALADDDKRTLKLARQRNVSVVVEERREELERGAALVKGYLERRGANLIRKNVSFKKDLEAKMREMVIKRESEAKAQVAKVKTHRALAKEPILFTKSALDHAHPDQPTSARSSNLTPRCGYRSHLSGGSQVHRSPPGVGIHSAAGMDDSIREEEETKMQGHFPVLESPDTCRFMFDVLKPKAVLRCNPWQPQSVAIGT